jgi:hypothetical protein
MVDDKNPLGVVSNVAHRTMSDLSKQSEAELLVVIEQSKDASVRGAVRLELETRSLRRLRISADWQTRVARLALLSASAAGLGSLAAAVMAWMQR